MSRPTLPVDGAPPSGEDTDWRLLERLSQGDLSAMPVIRERYRRRIWRYAFRILKFPDRADDVVQETFFRLFRGARRYRTLESKFGLMPLLLRIASNAASTLRTRQGLFERVQRSYAYVANSQAEPADHPVLAAEAEEKLNAALGQLPSPFRVPLVLYEVHGWTYEEIALFCGMNAGTVKSRIGRGRDLLRTLLYNYWKA